MFKCKKYIIPHLLILIVSVATQAQKVSIEENLQTIRTYPYSDFNPLPAMAINKNALPFYPYSMIDGYTATGIDKKWKVVKLENDFISVTVLPEVGGKVMGAIEKATGKEFLYLNQVLKFRSIGVRGPWASGGIEHNFGLDLGHAPWTASPVDYLMTNNPDGIVSCWVGGLDLASRSEWRVRINLPKDKAYFETEALWFNPLPVDQAYLSWANAAYKATNDLQFYFPGNYHIEHSGAAAPWPVDAQGRNISVYKNNNFGGSKSYHVMGDTRNWFGGYWKNASFGFGHWSLYADAPGKKLWIWSLARDGAIWENLLTDNDGQYIEAQSGANFNQSGEKSGYHSPFRQLIHKPLYAETKTDYWFPVKETNGIVDANVHGAMNVEIMDDSMHITISPLQKIDDSLVVSVSQNIVFSEKLQLVPMQTFRRSLAFKDKPGLNFTVNVGNRKLYYNTIPETLITRPVRTDDDINDFDSAERLFRMGEEQNAMRNFNEAMALYEKCIEKSPTHSGALTKIAELYFRSGEYKKGLPFARRVLSYSAYDGAANYIYGFLLYKLNNLNEAEEAFSIAAKTMEFRSAAYGQISNIELKRKNFEEAVLFAQKALDYNRYNLSAAGSLISAYRKSGHQSRQEEALEALLKTDPLNQYGRFEKYLSGAETPAARATFQAGIQNEFPQETYLEVALQYVSSGMSEEAIKLLEMAPPFPTVYYWLAYLHRETSKQASDTYLSKAQSLSPRLVFPFRHETLEVLDWAEQQQHSWKPIYYAALIQWHHKNISAAKSLFGQCDSEPDYGPFYLSRGILFSDDETKKDAVLADFRRALALEPNEWRAWHALSEFYQSAGTFDSQFENARKAHEKFPSNAVINIDYAKALLNTERPGECIRILNKTLVLPHEGASEGQEIFERANVLLALNHIQQKKYKPAIKDLLQAKTYPENLGSGKPYNPDYRLHDYLLSYCEMKLGNKQQAVQYDQQIMNSSLDKEKFNWPRNEASNYISVLTLEKHGKISELAELMKGWSHFQDSLRNWNIRSRNPSPQMEWVFAKYKKSEAAADIENKELNSGIKNPFTLLLRALALTEEKQKHSN
jgi:Tfp pilus assembly protein PilF